MGEEIKITFETLYGILLKEKSKEDIQELEPTFIESVKIYLAGKRSMLFKTEDQQMLFSEKEQQKTLKQIGNIIKILRELYDRREKKIINLALNKSKTNSESIDTSKLLDKGKDMFYMLVDIMNLNRTNIFCKMIDDDKTKNIITKTIEKEQDTQIEKPNETKPDISNKDTINVKFLTPVPKFIDPKLKVHGPFESDDTAELPVSVVDVLLKKGKVKVI